MVQSVAYALSKEFSGRGLRSMTAFTKASACAENYSPRR